MACDFGARETRQLCQRLSTRLKPQGSLLPFIYEFFATRNVKQLSPLLLTLPILRSSQADRVANSPARKLTVTVWPLSARMAAFRYGRKRNRGVIPSAP